MCYWLVLSSLAGSKMQILFGIYLLRFIISIKQVIVLLLLTRLPTLAGSETLSDALFYVLLLPMPTPVWVYILLKFG